MLCYAVRLPYIDVLRGDGTIDVSGIVVVINTTGTIGATAASIDYRCTIHTSYEQISMAYAEVKRDDKRTAIPDVHLVSSKPTRAPSALFASLLTA